MRRYADLAELALASIPDIQVQRIGLAPAKIPRRVPSVLRTLWHHTTVAHNARRLSKRRDIDLFHVIDGSHGYVASCLPPGRTIVTVHDLIPHLQSENFFPVAPPSRAARWIIRRALLGLGSAIHLVCDSSATQADLVRALDTVVDRTSVIFPPLEPSFFDPVAVPENVAPAIPFIFHLGNNAFYKNRRGVLEIFSRIASSVPHRLVMAGPPPTGEMYAFGHAKGLHERISFIENPSDDRVRALYREASLFLFPSRYEGFGWPPLEAMASGCPVVCSDAGSLAEVVDDAALKAAPDDIETFSSHCIDILGNPAMARSIRDRGFARADQFRLETFGARLAAVYRETLQQKIKPLESFPC